MDSDRIKEEQLQRREQELKERELAIRLRELEADVNEPASKTVKHSKTKGAVSPGYKTLFKVGKFLALAVVTVVAIKIAAALAGVLILLGIFWAAYKVFFEGHRSKR
ncbi:MAG: hypothetical protein QNJ46_13185 [Leptolyngbyaceae cyanobacterium MO_188.B28]|nr:hypothetical protein [Leptolyngbyaceae cyanobacterium MO_188.B28]